MKRIFAAAALVLTMPLLSCGTWKAWEKAQQAERLKEWDEAVTQYDKGLESDPDNMKLRIAQQRAKLEASRVHFEKGKTYEAAALTAKTPTEQYRLAQLAATELEVTVKLDSTNQFAAVELGKTVAMLQDLSRAADAASLEAQKKRARALSGKVAPPQLNPASDQPISLSFPHDTPVKEIYRALGNAFGINVMFDQAVKDDRISIELKDVTAQQALERVMQAANHFYKVLDEHTIIVVPDNPQARRDYEDLVIRTFYLSNGDAEQVTNVVRTMIEARNVFPLKALNAITIRDTADKVRIAEKIIEANDKAKAEVVVDVELLQLDINKTRNLGMDVTGTSGSLQAVSQPDDKGARNPLTAVTRQQLAHLGAGDLMFSIPSVEYAFLKQATNSELLANPELRISEGEKATLHIGSRIPVPVSTFTSVATTTSGGTFAPVTSFQYQDIGIKVSIEPRVHHNREVTLKLTVEVSSLGGSAPGTGAGTGTPSQPIFNTRTIESTIRLKDGETNFLAGLIQDSRNDSDNQTPFLGEIPILGRLFTTNLHQQTRTDLILTMTPHIVRIPDITDEDLSPMWVGTANNITFRGVSPRIESQTANDPFTARPDLSSTTGGGRGAAAFPPETTPVAPPAPLVTPSPGGLPNSPFNGRPAPVNPNPQPVQPQAQLNDPPKAVATVAGIQVSQGTAPTDPFAATPAGTASASTLKPESTAVASTGTVPTPTAAPEMASLSPRLSPQPVTVNLKPGAERTWSVVAMDLDGLTAPQIVMHFDPHALEVLDLSFGPAIAINTATPPVVNIDREGGTIRISSSDTAHPLQFAGGGELVTLRVRGGVSGETFLVLDNPDFRNADGKMVMSTISGGRAKVE